MPEEVDDSGSSSSADVSIDSSSYSFGGTTSPAQGQMLQLPDGTTSYLPSLRVHSGSSRGTSTGSNSVASTAPSSLFETSRARNGQLYTADSSMVSLTSTAPTSVGHGSDDEAAHHEIGKKRSRDASDEDEMDLDDERDREERSREDKQRSRRYHGGDEGSSTVDSDQHEHTRHSLASPTLPHRPLIGRSSRPTHSSLRPKLQLRDAAFLFDLSPHIAVEPLGVSSLDRLMGADAEDATHEEAEQDENQPDAFIKDESQLDDEARLALEARRCAFAKSTGADAAAASSHHLTARQRYLVNQQGPLTMILDQRNEEAKTSPQKADDDSAAAPGKRTRTKEPDPVVDVIDPVRLLAGLCD